MSSDVEDPRFVYADERRLVRINALEDPELWQDSSDVAQLLLSSGQVTIMVTGGPWLGSRNAFACRWIWDRAGVKVRIAENSGPSCRPFGSTDQIPPRGDQTYGGSLARRLIRPGENDGEREKIEASIGSDYYVPERCDFG